MNIPIHSQAGHVHPKRACARAAARVAAAHGWVVARAPAHAASGHSLTAVVRHVAAAFGRNLGDISHLAGGHRRQGHRHLRGEAHLVAVGKAIIGNGVGTHIVGRVGSEVFERTAKAAYTHTVCRVAAVYIGARFRAPAHATHEHMATLRQCKHATCHRACGGDVGRRGGLHDGRRSLREDEAYRLGTQGTVHVAHTRREMGEAAGPLALVISGKAEWPFHHVAFHGSEACQSLVDLHGHGIGIADPIPAWG